MTNFGDLGGYGNIFQLAKQALPSTSTFLANAISGNPPWLGIEHFLKTGCDTYLPFHMEDDLKNLQDGFVSMDCESDLK